MARLISLPPLVGFLATDFLLNYLDFTSGETLQKLADLGITLLLFTAHHANDLLMAKTGVLLASVVAGVSGFLWLYFSAEKSRR